MHQPQLGNYCPISVVPIVEKILEKLLLLESAYTWRVISYYTIFRVLIGMIDMLTKFCLIQLIQLYRQQIMVNMFVLP